MVFSDRESSQRLVEGVGVIANNFVCPDEFTVDIRKDSP